MALSVENENQKEIQGTLNKEETKYKSIPSKKNIGILKVTRTVAGKIQKSKYKPRWYRYKRKNSNITTLPRIDIK